jgi:hypothetical protein
MANAKYFHKATTKKTFANAETFAMLVVIVSALGSFQTRGY